MIPFAILSGKIKTKTDEKEIRLLELSPDYFTKVGRESQETFCNYRTMMSNFVEMLYRQLLVLCLCPCVLYDILFIPAKNIYSYSQLKEGTYAYGTASVKNI